VAVGEHAKQLSLCDGGPDLLLWTDKPIFLGRAVKDGDGYKYPNHWNSLSSRHCNLVYQTAAGGEVRYQPAAILHHSAAHLLFCTTAPRRPIDGSCSA
jgi:hypothetical protein